MVESQLMVGDQAAAMEEPVVQPMPESAGFMDSVYNFLDRHPLAEKLAITLGIVGTGSAAAMIAATPAEASPVAQASTAHIWSVLGGDPFVRDGVHSRRGLKHLLNSDRGKTALKDLGLNGKEVQAVDQAVRHNQETACTLNNGDHFNGMVFGQFGETENDVTYTGGSAPAYCLSVRVPEGHEIKTIQLKIPKKCANIALEREIVRLQQQKTAQVEVLKIAEDDQGHLLPATPTDTFRFEVECRGKGGLIDRTVVYNGSPQNLARCLVGKRVVVKELSTLGPDQWTMLTPGKQAMRVKRGSNEFVFKDREVPPTPQTPPGVPPKNGTEGPGAGTPGQPGGPGAGGSPGNTGSGETCIDPADTTDGDLNPNTSGDIMQGPADQIGYCMGPAQPMQNP